MATRTQIKQIRVLAQKLPFLASTRNHQNGLFQKYARLVRFADICQTVLIGLAHIHQALLKGLARLAKGKFGECYANSANLASLG
jgi:hypothetical protein